MRLTIKSQPEDFVVEEIAELPLVNQGPYLAYILKKQGWNTLDLINKIARETRIPRGAFSYGGRKDRHACTRQYIAVKNPNVLELNKDDYSLKFYGVMERPMGPDLIQGNHFKITVRNLAATAANAALGRMEEIKQHGFANYFDDQRFGSFDPKQGFLAEKLLKGHFNGGLKIYLTAPRGADNKAAQERKKYFSAHWKDWPDCLKKSATKFEKNAFSRLIKNPNSFIELLRQVPREEMAGYFSAYQAYIWNEVLRQVIRGKARSPFQVYPGIAGDYLFLAASEKEGLAELKQLSLPTMPVKSRIDDKSCAAVYSRVLAVNNIKPPMFNKLKIRQAFFKSTPRPVSVLPKGLLAAIADDDKYAGRKKLVLNFSLPRGSFGTMLIKYLFSR